MEKINAESLDAATAAASDKSDTDEAEASIVSPVITNEKTTAFSVVPLPDL